MFNQAIFALDKMKRSLEWQEGCGWRVRWVGK